MNMATRPVALAGCSEAEWAVRCDLAALYRLLAYFRMTDIIYTHLTALSEARTRTALQTLHREVAPR